MVMNAFAFGLVVLLLLGATRRRRAGVGRTQRPACRRLRDQRRRHVERRPGPRGSQRDLDAESGDRVELVRSFQSDPTLKPVLGAQALVGYYITRSFAIEGGMQYARPTLSSAPDRRFRGRAVD